MNWLLELRGVSKTFLRGRSRRKVLDDVSLVVSPGQFAAIFGSRGEGKTTLLRIAAGFESADSGAVMFGGRELGTMSASALAAVHRDDIAWVDRTGPRGMGLTVLDYVSLPILPGKKRRVAAHLATQALEETGVGDCASATWDDLCDVERTLVAIAHALVREPHLILVDDPTAGVDMLARGSILGLLRRTAENTGAGVLMAVPDVPSMVRSHEVYSLSGGSLLGAATHVQDAAGVVLDFPGRGLSV